MSQIQYQLRGPKLEELKAKAFELYGPQARIVSAERVSVGGIGGLLARHHFELTVEAPAPAAAAAPVTFGFPARTGIADLLADADNADGPVSAAPALPEPTTMTADFERLFAQITAAAGMPEAANRAAAVEAERVAMPQPAAPVSIPVSADPRSLTLADYLASLAAAPEAAPQRGSRRRDRKEAANAEREAQLASRHLLPEISRSFTPVEPPALIEEPAVQSPVSSLLPAPVPATTQSGGPYTFDLEFDPDDPFVEDGMIVENGILVSLHDEGDQDGEHDDEDLEHGGEAFLSRRMADLPPSPQPLRAPGKLVLFLGLGADAGKAARAMARDGKLMDIRYGGEAAQRASTAVNRRKEALIARQEASERKRAVYLAYGASSIADNLANLVSMRPHQVWVVVDASRKVEDIQLWLAHIQRSLNVDAIAVVGTGYTATPGTVTELDIPLGWTDNPYPFWFGIN